MLPADAVLWSLDRVSVGVDMMCARCVNEKMQERDETEGALPLLCVCVRCRQVLVRLLGYSMNPTVVIHISCAQTESLFAEK